MLKSTYRYTVGMDKSQKSILLFLLVRLFALLKCYWWISFSFYHRPISQLIPDPLVSSSLWRFSPRKSLSKPSSWVRFAIPLPMCRVHSGWSGSRSCTSKLLHRKLHNFLQMNPGLCQTLRTLIHCGMTRNPLQSTRMMQCRHCWYLLIIYQYHKRLCSTIN